MTLLSKYLQANTFHPKQQKHPTSSKWKEKKTRCGKVHRQQSGHPEAFRQAPNKQRQPHCLDAVINTTEHDTDIVSAYIYAGDCRFKYHSTYMFCRFVKPINAPFWIPVMPTFAKYLHATNQHAINTTILMWNDAFLKNKTTLDSDTLR